MIWEDTRKVQFDSTMQFSHGYDFDGLYHMRSEADTPNGRFMVWPDCIGRPSWNFYGGDDGVFSSGYESEAAAQEEVERNYL